MSKLSYIHDKITIKTDYLQSIIYQLLFLYYLLMLLMFICNKNVNLQTARYIHIRLIRYDILLVCVLSFDHSDIILNWYII